MALNGKRVLLIIGGGIAAYKSLELIREITKRGGSVRAMVYVGRGGEARGVSPAPGYLEAVIAAAASPASSVASSIARAACGSRSSPE